MHVELLVEEPSMAAALEILLPVLVTTSVTCQVLDFGGKTRMLQVLPGRLQGYRAWIPEDFRILVLVDRDDDDCRVLKEQLEKMAAAAGFATPAAVLTGTSFRMLNRIAIEELESWFLGDVTALVAAYPGISPHLARKTAYRDPDAIPGGAWEALERELQRAGYHRTGLLKIEAARTIARHMDPDRNRSQSFQVFRRGLAALTAWPA